ncbi:MAG: alpha/beta hydrolase [Acidobacteria bacterium]|nr:alpha/beta hydrolase [Acidobacteriota bacterium]
MRKVLLAICWLLAAPGAFLGALIVLPAPSHDLWLAAVGASEWSVWLVLAGAVGLLCGGAALLMKSRSAPARIGFALNLLTVACAAMPVVEAFSVASREGVSLSWERYLFGIERAAARIPVDVQRDVEFARPVGRPLRLDVYQPRRPATGERQANDRAFALLPAVIVIHGGSWSSGVKSDFARYDRWLAEGGRVVFDAEYRLADDAHRFPAQLFDVRCAIVWVKSHAAQYGVDPERVALLGRSAGGQLALLAAYTAHEPSSQTDSCDAQDTSVRAVISFYGPTDLVWDYTHTGRPDVIDTPRKLENFLGGSPANASQTYAAASPIEHVSAQSPPTLFLHGGHDQLVLTGNVERIIPKLAAARVSYTYLYLPWASHGFDYNFNGWGSQIAQDKINKFLDAYL